MKSIPPLEKIICPCCGSCGSCGSRGSRGSTLATDSEICANCHARPVGEPLVQPEALLPGLGPAFTAMFVALLVIVAFLAMWLFGNDMKVARVLLVMALGENTTFTKSLLQLDPSLLQYRIFTYDAYRLACYMSLGLIPLSLLGIWLARRARKLAQLQPLRFGGGRLATGSFVLSVILCLSFSAAGISWIPRAIQQGRAKHIAAVRAEFYRLHSEALNRYYAEFNTYPQELSDLREFVPEVIPHTDYWGNAIKYSPTALIASKNSTPGYSNYQLVSAGPDGILDTADDIRMVDGVIVNTSDETDWLSSFYALISHEKANDK